MHTLSVKKSATGMYESAISVDGVDIWEMHAEFRNTDQKVIKHIIGTNVYQMYKGRWSVTLPDDFRVFSADTFDKATGNALEYITERDNPQWVDVY